ncbi:hypothetical protein SCAR479_09577 [Seiridium cardinale]|uniref:Uncharacterized protein n=1 Tax=Seiridium cardinale TaxID=138064 RepID=A0ABR2XJX6_9PEZI
MNAKFWQLRKAETIQVMDETGVVDVKRYDGSIQRELGWHEIPQVDRAQERKRICFGCGIMAAKGSRVTLSYNNCPSMLLKHHHIASMHKLFEVL